MPTGGSELVLCHITQRRRGHVGINRRGAVQKGQRRQGHVIGRARLRLVKMRTHDQLGPCQSIWQISAERPSKSQTRPCARTLPLLAVAMVMSGPIQ